MLDMDKNVIVFEIDKCDDAISRTEEETKAIEEKNEHFLKTRLSVTIFLVIVKKPLLIILISIRTV